jgi:hypothetical protein
MFSKKNKSNFLPCAIINNPETSSLSVSKVSLSYLDFFSSGPIYINEIAFICGGEKRFLHV